VEIRGQSRSQNGPLLRRPGEPRVGTERERGGLVTKRRWWLRLVVLALASGAVAAWILFENERGRPQRETRVEPGGNVAEKGSLEEPLEEGFLGKRSEVESASEMPASNLLAGRALDASSRPVPGARVFVAHASERRAGPIYGELPQEETWHRFEALTTEDGRFRFEDLRPGRSRVAIWADDFAPRELNQVVVPRIGSLDLGDVTLVAGAILEGRVVDRAGRGVPHARISREEAGGGSFFGSVASYSSLAITDDEGRFRTRASQPGDWVIRIESDEHPSAWFDVAARVSGVLRGQVFSLEAGWSISGQLVAPGVADLSTCAVNLKYAGDARALPGVRDEHRLRTVSCAADGTFRCDRLRAVDEATQYELEGVRIHGQLRLRITEPVRVAVGSHDVLLTGVPAAGLAFELRSAADGRPIEGPSVHLLLENGSRFDVAEGGDLLEIGPGRYRVAGICRASGLDALAMEIRKDGFRVCSLSELELAAGVERDLGTIRLQPATALEVLVVDHASGSPVAGAEVLRDSSDAPARAPREPGRSEVHYDPKSATTTTDASGIATLALASGHVNQVRVTHPEFAPALSEPLMAGYEPKLLKIELERGATLDVFVESAGVGFPGDEVMVASQNLTKRMTGLDSSHRDTRRFIETDSDGMAHLEHLPAGWTEVNRTGGSDASARRILLQNETSHQVVLSANPEISTRLLVRENGEALPGAKVILFWAGSGDPYWRQMPVTSGATDGTGWVLFEGLAMGEYELLIVHGTRDLGSTDRIEWKQNGAESVVDLERADVTGQVRTADGEAVPDCPVYVLEERRADPETLRRLVSSPGSLLDTAPREGVGSGRTDSAGRYSFQGLPTARTLIVTAVPQQGVLAQPQSLRLRSGERLTVADLIAEPGGTLSLRLEADEDDPRLFRAGLLPLEPIDERRLPGDEAFDRSGLATFRHLAPGPWRVSLYSRFGKQALSEKRVEIVGAATTELTVRPAD